MLLSDRQHSLLLGRFHGYGRAKKWALFFSFLLLSRHKSLNGAQSARTRSKSVRKIRPADQTRAHGRSFPDFYAYRLVLLTGLPVRPSKN